MNSVLPFEPIVTAPDYPRLTQWRSNPASPGVDISKTTDCLCRWLRALRNTSDSRRPEMIRLAIEIHKL